MELVIDEIDDFVKDDQFEHSVQGVPLGKDVILHFRLNDESHENLRHIVTWLTSVCSSVHLAVEEIGKNGRRHIHCVIQVKNKSTLIQQFHKQTSGRYKGNKAYSCESLTKDIERIYIYLCKGTRFTLPNVLYKIKSIDVSYYHAEYWKILPIENDWSINPTHNNPIKKRTLTWSENLTNEIREKYPNNNWEYQATCIDLLWNMVTKALGKSSKKLSCNIIRDLVMGQLNALNPNSFGIRVTLKNNAFPDLFGES